jgi:exoribonuclease R
MTTYTIQINSRNYTSFETYNLNTNETIHTLTINPIQSKLFSDDIFSVDDSTSQVTIVSSPIRDGVLLPGVLVVDGNKTFGRLKSRLLYKCIPDDVRLPAFLVPHELKKVGFSKAFVNLYVLFKYDNWNDKHPIGKLENVIGTIDNLSNYYEYQLYCKHLHISIQSLQKAASSAVSSYETHDHIFHSLFATYPDLKERLDCEIITIDPVNSTDYDDGLSCVCLENGTVKLSVYISNVALIMDALQLWNWMSSRVSTIYLPDKKRPMLPPLLSERICSLQKQVQRVALVMDVYIQNNVISNVQFCNAIIRVANNYAYDDPLLQSNQTFQLALHAVQQISVEPVHDSHALVSWLMVYMNKTCASHLSLHNVGIYRHTRTVNDAPIWNKLSAEYTLHMGRDSDTYLRMTSPIRRVVDMLNIMQFQKMLGMISFSQEAEVCYDKWVGKLDDINKSTKKIQKIERECLLLDKCTHNPRLLEDVYDGYILDGHIINNSSPCMRKYTVYLPQLKLYSEVVTDACMDEGIMKRMKLFVFTNEEKFKKKIRVQIVE